MAQVFHHAANTVAKVTMLAVIALIAGLGIFGWEVNNSYNVYRHEPLRQPIPFSHKHHVTDDGIDCRYCHTTVETSSFAGIPPTHTCMSCHSKIWVNSPMLAPVRDSYSTDTSIAWVRVNELPDFVYFNHSIHVNKGVGCSTCHGSINQMPLVFQASPLLMEWCLGCHRNPQQVLRPLDQVFNMDWKAPSNQEEIGKQFAAERKIRTTAELTSCSTCHR